MYRKKTWTSSPTLLLLLPRDTLVSRTPYSQRIMYPKFFIQHMYRGDDSLSRTPNVDKMICHYSLHQHGHTSRRWTRMT